MSDILNYRFYLNFKNEGSFGRIEMTEAVGFDGASFVVEQDAKRYGRDVYRINEEINLNFFKGEFDASTMATLPNGTVIYNLTMGYDYLIDVFYRFGFEANVDFEVELNGNLFIPSNLDFQTCETDGYSYFSCKAVQVQDKQLIKRRSDIVTDIFSTEDLDGNAVIPAITENILLKAKPITQESEWSMIGEQSFFHPFLSGGGGTVYYNAQFNLTKSNIDDTLSYLPFYTTVQANLGDVGFIDAKNDLTDVIININLKAVFSKLVGNFTNAVGSRIRLRYGIIEDINDPVGTNIVPFTQSWLNGSLGWEISEASPVLDIDFSVQRIVQIPLDYRLIIYFEQETSFLGGGNTKFSLSEYNIDVTATATAIDTVIKGVRYIDVFKENIRRINGFEVVAPRYDVGGEYYDQYAFTGQLIKQRDDLPFPVTFKDITEDLQELNSDYQITDKMYIGQYQDFYPNKEIAVFVSSPDDTFKILFNERYAINEFSYEYKTFEQDKDEENTIDAIHTESQWLTSNKQVENKKEISLSLIRDAYKLEVARKEASKETTSTKDDDKMYVLDVVPLAPNTRGGFSASMTHNIDSDGNVQLLKDADLPSWSLLGFSVGNTDFRILSNDNEGTYRVVELDSTIITLETLTPSTQSFNGVSYTEVSYSYDNVLLTNRTNEGLIFSENLLNADKFANLKYSIKRNIIPWQPYLKTASISEGGTFRNTYFKDNGECTTQFEGEAEQIKENANILNADLVNGFLTPYNFETRLLAPFDDMRALLTSIDTINEDNSIGGFIRCIDNKGKVIKLYPQKIEYLPSTESLSVVGEERNEGNGVTITIDGGIVTVNEVGYPIEELSTPFYEFKGEYMQIYDINKLPIINPTKYTDITVDGLTFNSVSDLLNYLINI